MPGIRHQKIFVTRAIKDRRHRFNIVPFSTQPGLDECRFIERFCSARVEYSQHERRRLESDGVQALRQVQVVPSLLYLPLEVVRDWGP
jgi:hypothetical protein